MLTKDDIFGAVRISGGTAKVSCDRTEPARRLCLGSPERDASARMRRAPWQRGPGLRLVPGLGPARPPVFRAARSVVPI